MVNRRYVREVPDGVAREVYFLRRVNNTGGAQAPPSFARIIIPGRIIIKTAIILRVPMRAGAGAGGGGQGAARGRAGGQGDA